MNEEFLTYLLHNFGFPVFVAIVLLWDKIKTNGNLLQVVSNNNELLREIKNNFLKGG